MFTPLRVTWQTVPCPDCGRVVAFLPGQLVNVCAYCNRPVTRGLE